MDLLRVKTFTSVSIGAEELCVLLGHKISEIKRMEIVKDRDIKCEEFEAYIRDVRRKKVNEEILLYSAIGTRFWFWLILPLCFAFGSFTFLYSLYPGVGLVIAFILAYATACVRHIIAILLYSDFVEEITNRKGVERTLVESLVQVTEIQNIEIPDMDKADDVSTPLVMTTATSV